MLQWDICASLLSLTKLKSVLYRILENGGEAVSAMGRL